MCAETHLGLPAGLQVIMKRRRHFILVFKIVKFYVSYKNISLISLLLFSVDLCRLCPDGVMYVCFCFFLPSVCNVIHMQQGYKTVLFLPLQMFTLSTLRNDHILHCTQNYRGLLWVQLLFVRPNFKKPWLLFSL